MNGTPRRKSANRKDQAFEDRLRKALKHPGVKEAMEVYGSWRQIDEAARPYRKAMATKKVVYLSNTSNPKSLRKK